MCMTILPGSNIPTMVLHHVKVNELDTINEPKPKRYGGMKLDSDLCEHEFNKSVILR
jgi:hypothetical protein